MREVTATEFKAGCLRLIDESDEEGLVVTRYGRPVARVLPIRPDIREYIGLIPDLIANPDDPIWRER